MAALVNEFPDVVELLNGTAANYTVSRGPSDTFCHRPPVDLRFSWKHADFIKVFAPTDKAFEKIPDHAPKPSKDDLKKILTYHVSPEYFPAGRVLVTHTIPTLLSVDTLGIGPQRLGTEISLKGLTVNFYSRIVAIDIVSILSHSTFLRADKASLAQTA